MIYQPRRGKRMVFERTIKVIAHLVPSGKTMTFYYHCTFQADRDHMFIVKIRHNVPPPVYYGQSVVETLDARIRNAGLN